MTDLKEILSNYLYLIIIFAIFLVALLGIIVFFNQFSNKRRIHLYGLLMDLNNMQILALSLIIINFLLLAYVLVTKLSLSVAVAIVSFILIFLAFLLNKNYKYLVINSLMNLVSIGLVYLANLVNELRLASSSEMYFILQVLVNVFGLLFYLISAIKYIKNIRTKGGSYAKNN